MTSLIICDAKRCSNEKVGCLLGCINKDFIEKLRKTDDLSAYISPIIDKIENRTFVKELPFRYNRLIDLEHNVNNFVFFY